jgi:hypothetical protein
LRWNRKAAECAQGGYQYPTSFFHNFVFSFIYFGLGEFALRVRLLENILGGAPHPRSESDTHRVSCLTGYTFCRGGCGRNPDDPSRRKKLRSAARESGSMRYESTFSRTVTFVRSMILRLSDDDGKSPHSDYGGALSQVIATPAIGVVELLRRRR